MSRNEAINQKDKIYKKIIRQNNNNFSSNRLANFNIFRERVCVYVIITFFLRKVFFYEISITMRLLIIITTINEFLDGSWLVWWLVE